MKVTFNINFHTVWGQKLCVVGSIPELGSWEPALAKEMNYSGDGNWKLELDLPPDIKDIEYRYLMENYSVSKNYEIIMSVLEVE